MRRGGNTSIAVGSLLCACATFSACSYDFDALVAQPGGSAGAGGSSGAAGDDGGGTGGSNGGAGTAGAGTGGGKGGSGGTSGTDAGSEAGKGGDARVDAFSDRSPNTIGDVRADAAFDCAALGGTIYQSHCYYPSTALTNWDTAKTTGCALPSHLAVITTAGEQGVVSAILAGDDRWIGLRKDPGPPNNEMAFRWVTGEQLSFKTWDAYDSGAPEPNYTGDCVRMRLTNQWADTPCTELHAAVCERE
jgi:hypothetical protein